MNRKLASTILFFCLIFGLSNILYAQKPVVSKETADMFERPSISIDDKLFQGFDTLQIVIEDLHKILTNNGLNESQIKNDVEIKLRQAKFKISEYATPYIYVNVNAMDADGLIAYSLDVSLRQLVLLERDKSVSTTVPTWHKREIGVVGKNRVNSIREVIKDYVDEFILSYLKANEKVSKNTSITKTETEPEDIARGFVYAPDKRPEQVKAKSDSPFTATYIGGNGPPEVEIFNDSDRTIYIDLGQGKLTAYTILSKKSISLKLVNGNYNYKASAARVSPIQGINEFQTGYQYTWRFTISKR